MKLLKDLQWESVLNLLFYELTLFHFKCSGTHTCKKVIFQLPSLFVANLGLLLLIFKIMSSIKFS